MYFDLLKLREKLIFCQVSQKITINFQKVGFFISFERIFQFAKKQIFYETKDISYMTRGNQFSSSKDSLFFNTSSLNNR